MTPQERLEFNKLKQDMELLKNSATIPYDVDSAFRDRFGINAMTPLLGSVKVATSENQAVNEAGSDSYSVLKAPDGFLQVTVSGTVYYLPYFN